MSIEEVIDGVKSGDLEEMFGSGTAGFIEAPLQEKVLAGLFLK